MTKRGPKKQEDDQALVVAPSAVLAADETAEDVPLPPVLGSNAGPGARERVQAFFSSVDELFERWIARHQSQHSKRAYRGDVMAFVAFLGIEWPKEATEILRATVADVQTWRDEMLEAGMAPKTLNRRVASVSSLGSREQRNGKLHSASPPVAPPVAPPLGQRKTCVTSARQPWDTAVPVRFLSPAQRAEYGCYVAVPSSRDLAEFFHLDDADHALIARKRTDPNRLGFALQLTTVRYLGTFLEDPGDVPRVVIDLLARQLGIQSSTASDAYRKGAPRYIHAAQICHACGYREFTDPDAGFRLTRWLYAQCWSGTEQASVLFDRATSWLLSHRVLLPAATTLERFVARLRYRVEEHVCRELTRDIGPARWARLQGLLAIPHGSDRSLLESLRAGPTRISVPALVQALDRLRIVRELRIGKAGGSTSVPPTRTAALARYAMKASVTGIARLPRQRQTAVLLAFVRTVEASAHDDVLDLLEALLQEIFAGAKKADRKARTRRMKDLDAVALTLGRACAPLLDSAVPGSRLRDSVFSEVSQTELAEALENLQALVRPPDDVFYQELKQRYRRVRRFLPTLLKNVEFLGAPDGAGVVSALKYLKHYDSAHADLPDHLLADVPGIWLRHVLPDTGGIDPCAYTFSVLDRFRTALRRRDVFVANSWRYSDPRAGLLTGAEWEQTRPTICRTLGFGAKPGPVLTALSEELDRTYRGVASRLPDNHAVRFEQASGKPNLVLSPLERNQEPASLTTLREKVAERLPRVDLPELLLEIAARTGFVKAFTHVSRSRARVSDLDVSVCAVLMSQACNIGIEPLVHQRSASLRRDRLSWVHHNYLRDETIAAANAYLVEAQSRVPLAQAWGGGEVASADGMRFVVPVRTVHSGPNPKYFGIGRGVTYYNLVSDQFSGLNAIVVPGTLRDSLVLLAVVLQQQTHMNPTRIMTDTGAYSDVVFGLFRMLGYRFSSRLADVAGTRFWRVDPNADYGPLNPLARQRVRLERIVPHWDDMLRTAG